MKYALNKIAKRGGISDTYLRDFIEKFIPIAYFRIPLFRERFLKLITERINEENQNISSTEKESNEKESNEESYKETAGETTDPQANAVIRKPSVAKLKKIQQSNEIEEWFRIEFPKKDNYTEQQDFQKKESVENVADQSDYTSSDTETEKDEPPPEPQPESPRQTRKKYEGAIGHYFDWDRYFYDHLPEENEQKKESDRILKASIESNKWHDRIKKRGIGFLLIITEWAKYVKSAIVRKNIFWQDVPGYKIIVKGVLREMQQRPLLLYPDALIDATMALLSNEKVTKLVS